MTPSLASFLTHSLTSPTTPVVTDVGTAVYVVVVPVTVTVLVVIFLGASIVMVTCIYYVKRKKGEIYFNVSTRSYIIT